jgi:hypothetical protein
VNPRRSEFCNNAGELIRSIAIEYLFGVPYGRTRADLEGSIGNIGYMEETQSEGSVACNIPDSWASGVFVKQVGGNPIQGALWISDGTGEVVCHNLPFLD